MWRYIVFLLLCVISTSTSGDVENAGKHVAAMCAGNVTTYTNVTCDYSSRKTDLHPNVTKDTSCKLNVGKKSLKYFQRKYQHLQFNFAQLLLTFQNQSDTMSVSSTKCVIQPLTWVWTHTGQEGAYKALFWPRDFSILSLETLERRIYGPYCVFINMSGDCSSFVIGEMNTTLTIVSALSKLIPKPTTTAQFPVVGMADDTNMWCYTKMINMTATMRLFCRYMICPQETVGYSCCKHNTRTHALHCDGQPFRYSKVWWELPFVVGSFLFLFVPLLLISVSEKLYKVLRDPKSMSYEPNGQEDEWISGNHVCFSSAMFSPFHGFVLGHPIAVSRLVRITASFVPISITVIHLSIAWRHYSFRLFLTQLASKQVATDVASMLAGFELSRQNFLTIFGGPYIAFSMFVLLFATILSLPKSLPILLESGLPDPSPEQLSPLCVNMDTKSKLGATQSLHISIGYIKIYRTLVAQMVMLLNPTFWKFVLQCQIVRWKKLSCSVCKTWMFPVYFVTVPLYVAICVLECIFCLLYYGLPVVFFNVIVYRAYCLKIRQFFRNTSGRIAKLFMSLLVCLIAAILIYCFYILHILFVHSFVFLARVAIFTYTGFIAYPEHYRNYLICYLSVAIYVVESVRSMKLTYDELFDKTKLVCDIMMDDEKYEDSNVIKKVDSTVFIPQRLFNFVISHHKPLRIETFLMLYKLLLTIMVIYMSVVMLVLFDTFDHMALLTEIGTTVVICMAPKFLRRVFKSSGYENEVEERRTIKLWVIDYLGDFTSRQGEHQGRDRSVSLDVL